MPIKSTEEIKAELSKYYKKRRHVLLYGNSRINPKGLVLDVHIENGGRVDTIQYVGREKEEVFLKNIAEALNNDKLKNEDPRKRYEEVREMYKSSEKSWRHLKGIHNVLYEDWYNIKIPCGPTLNVRGDEFLDFKGTLFVDMLDYELDKDAEYLCKLAAYIKEGKVSVNWLVVYIYNGRDYAPASFLDQFKHICLDGEKAIKESIVIDRIYQLLKYKGKKEKLDPIQMQLLRFLHENKDNLVTRNEILNNIWKGTDVYDKQITDHMTKIKKAFTGLGFEKEVVEKEIIETIKKSRTTEGGYIFHSNIVKLDFN